MLITGRDLRTKGAHLLLLLLERSRSDPAGTAYRAKHLGLYLERTWRDYATLVARCALGFRAIGLRPGERVAIMADACEEWAISDLGAQAAGAITYGIYPTASAAELEYQMRDGGAAIFVAEDQEYVDKIMPLLERLPQLRHVVVIDDAAMFDYAQDKFLGFDRLISASTVDADALEPLARAIDPAHPAFIVYTSGTTGHPKGALISHGRHVAAAANLIEHYPALGSREHRTVVYLPLCHILGRDVAITLPLLSRLVPHYGEDLEDLPQTLFEVAPTVLFSVPRYLQKFASQILLGIANTSFLKREAYELAMRTARRAVRARWDGTTNGQFLWWLAQVLVLRPARAKLGLDELRLLVSGGAALPKETMALWQMWGVDTVEIYGQTETAGGIIAGQRGPFPRPGGVGTVPTDWQVRLSENPADKGEILVRSEALFEGYWNQPKATAEVLGEDGWLRTGDVGEWRGEDLNLIDRARDFIVTSGGKTLSPSMIENLLRASPYIAEAMVVGQGRKFLSALIEIDFDTVAEWALGREISYTGFTSLAAHAEVRKLVASEIERANVELARVEQVKTFRILPKALDPEEEGEPVTPTRKVKRALMLEKFSELVEAMYDDREERLLSAGAGDVFARDQELQLHH